MVPMGSWAESRLKKLSETDKTRDNSKVGSGFGKNVSNWIGRDMVYPANVLHLATETGNKNHSAVFPKTLPSWFLKLFTKENDWVLDPFVGSGTTCRVASKLLRNSVGIELNPEYYNTARRREKYHLQICYCLREKVNMGEINRVALTEFVEENIKTFHNKRIDKLKSLKLSVLLKRKNPYLFKAKNINEASILIKDVLDAYLSSAASKSGDSFSEARYRFCCCVYRFQECSGDGTRCRCLLSCEGRPDTAQPGCRA